MRVPAKLGLFAGGLAVIFAVSFATASAVVPDDVAQKWTAEEAVPEHGPSEPMADGPAAAGVRGLSVEQDGYSLASVAAPTRVAEQSNLSFTITGPDGQPVTAFELAHTKQLHLIVVRTDGSEFRHVHPTLDEAGRWTVPWTWEAAGTYRLYADFVPSATGETLTLTSHLQVSGEFVPVPAEGPSTRTRVAGFDIVLTGELMTNQMAGLRASISQAGRPVTSLEPYLGAFGHLVVLRAGDLAYLHVHPEGEEPQEDSLSGPDITFFSQAPSVGRYLLYLDFKVDGVVHTAEFVLDATAGQTVSAPESGHQTDTTAPAGHGH